MIARLRGEVIEIGAGRLVMDVHGVGYQLFIPDSTATRLPPVGETAVLYVHTHVREDAIVLYGFVSRSEQHLFETVVGVAGVGPKLALSILSHVAPERFAQAVLTADEKSLTKIPGIGKKTAARMLLELKDKLGSAWESENGAAVSISGRDALLDPNHDAVAALMALGYSEDEAGAAVREASRAADDPDIPVEQVIRMALRLLDRIGG